MSGWWDSIFGNLPSPPPARPTSRGATFGANYQDMPTSQNVEDRRSSDIHNYAPSRPHDNNWESTNDYNKFDPGSFSAKFNDQEANRRAAQSWAAANMPSALPTQPLQDPGLPLDPSIMANIKRWQDQMMRAYPPDWQGPVTPGDPRRPMPGDPPMPNDPSTVPVGIMSAPMGGPDLPTAMQPPPTSPGPQRFWQNVPMPISSNIEDRRSDAPVNVDLAAPRSGLFPSQNNMYGLYQRQPLTAEQDQWLRMNMPQQLPTSLPPDPSRPAFVNQGSQALGNWQQNANGSWTHNPGQGSADPDLPSRMQFGGTTLNSVPWGQWQ